MFARFTVLLLLVGPGAALASNWMRSEDEAYFGASLQYERADQRWDEDGNRVDTSCSAHNWKHEQSYEYGLSYYRTLFGSLSYLDRRCGGSDAAGLGDVTLGMRGRLDVFRNGRSWEAAVIIPTGYSTSGEASVGSSRYGFSVGAFGRFGERQLVQGVRTTNYELGANLYFWEGSAPEQLSGYMKYNFAATADSHFYTALEGEYALVGRDKQPPAAVNSVTDFGYDQLNARLGYSTLVGYDWHLSIEASKVLWGRNVSDSTGVLLGVSRSFSD